MEIEHSEISISVFCYNNNDFIAEMNIKQNTEEQFIFDSSQYQYNLFVVIIRNLAPMLNNQNICYQAIFRKRMRNNIITIENKVEVINTNIILSIDNFPINSLFIDNDNNLNISFSKTKNREIINMIQELLNV